MDVLISITLANTIIITNTIHINMKCMEISIITTLCVTTIILMIALILDVRCVGHVHIRLRRRRGVITIIVGNTTVALIIMDRIRRINLRVRPVSNIINMSPRLCVLVLLVFAAMLILVVLLPVLQYPYYYY